MTATNAPTMPMARSTTHVTEVSMRAIRLTRYGGPDALALADIAIPVPTEQQVLVRVHATSVNAVDWHRMRGRPHLIRLSDGLRRPKDARLGADISGTVVAIGAAVTRFRVGDEVFGFGTGAFAEQVVVAEAGLVAKPAGVSFEQAGAVGVAATTALQGLRDRAQVRAGERVLIYGAGGGVGSFAVQIAKALGAHVTGVTRTASVSLMRDLGADEVVDHTTTDVLALGRTWDVVLDAGSDRSLLGWRRVMAPGGRLVLCGAPKGDWIAPIQRIVFGKVLSRFGSRTFIPFLAKRDLDDLERLRGWLEDGTIRPVIDRTYPLEQTAEAIRALEAGGVRGKVVITA